MVSQNCIRMGDLYLYLFLPVPPDYPLQYCACAGRLYLRSLGESRKAVADC